jgi:hypothetical protein
MSPSGDYLAKQTAPRQLTWRGAVLACPQTGRRLRGSITTSGHTVATILVVLFSMPLL